MPWPAISSRRACSCALSSEAPRRIAGVEPRPHLLEDRLELGHLRLRRVRRRVAGRKPLQHHARLQDLRRLLLVDEPHLRPAVGLVLDEPFLREAHERGAHRGPAHAQHLDQVRLDEALAGLQLPADDRRPQPLVGALGAAPRIVDTFAFQAGNEYPPPAGATTPPCVTTTSSCSAAARPASSRRRAGRGGPRVAIVERELVAASAPTGRACRPRRCCGRARPWSGARGAAATRRPTSRRPWPGATHRPDYADAARSAGWRRAASTCCAAPAGSPARACRSTARATRPSIVLATGAADHPAVAGLRELEGVWTNREATGMRAVPRRLLVLGGGPVGRARADRAAPGRRGRARRGRRAPARSRAGAWARRSARCSAATASSSRSACTPPAARRDGDDYVLGLEDGRSCAATGCSSRPAAARGSTTWGSRRSASSPASAGSRSTRACAPATASGRSAT